MVLAVQAKPVAALTGRCRALMPIAAAPYCHVMVVGLAMVHGVVGVLVPQAVAVVHKLAHVPVHALTQAQHVVVQAAQVLQPKLIAKAVTPIAVP